VVQHSEVITLIFGLFVLVIMFRNEKDLKRFSFWRPMKWGFMALMAAWVATILEGFFFHAFFNLMEHFLYALAAFIWMVGLIRLPRVRA
jgi:hypothetical protein